MAEHSRRYAALASKLAEEHGVVVHLSDQRAFGLTAERAKERKDEKQWLGHVEASTEPGQSLMQIVQDHVELCLQERTENPGLPFIIYGHSMGSVIATLLACTKEVSGFPLRGLALSGCPARDPGPINVVFGLLLRALRGIYGRSGIAPLTKALSFTRWNKKYTPNTYADDWLNRDLAEVKKYAEDPLCGHDCSVEVWHSLINGIGMAGEKERLAALPPELPSLVMVGGDDQAAINQLKKRSEKNVESEFLAAGRRPPKLVVYEGARHEVMHELCKEEFATELLNFINQSIKESEGTSLTAKSQPINARNPNPGNRLWHLGGEGCSMFYFQYVLRSRHTAPTHRFQIGGASYTSPTLPPSLGFRIGGASYTSRTLPPSRGFRIGGASNASPKGGFRLDC